MRVKGLQEPDDNGCQKDNGKRTLQEILCLFPQQLCHIFQSRHTVIGQLHDERNRFTPECGILGNQCGKNAHCNAGEIQEHHNQSAMLGEKCRSEKSINRQLRRTAHERNHHDGHFTVTLRGQCPAGHDTRYRTAKSNEHWHNASSGQTNLSQQLIHHKGDTGHVSGILQQRQEEEQRDNDGQEAQHTAHTVKDAVNYQ